MLDQRTGTEICDADVIASDGMHTVELEHLSRQTCVYATFLLPAGEYEVFIRRVGYEPVQLHDVEVHQDHPGCPVTPAHREVALRPNP